MKLFLQYSGTKKEKVRPTLVTSDGSLHDNLEQAEWYEYSVGKLNMRKLKIHVPEHTIMDFVDKLSLEKYLKENYHVMHYTVVSNVDALLFPSTLVLEEHEVNESGKVHYAVSVKSLEKFKQGLVDSILGFN